MYKRQVHDIGKNIVKVILENYGFEVIDLGRDVPVETVVNTCLLYTSHGAHAAVQQDGIALFEKFTRLHRSFPSFYTHTGCAARSGRTLSLIHI